MRQRESAEARLRESEAHFRLLVESVTDYAIFLLDTTGHVASWNAGAERIKGYRPDEIIGKHFSIFYSDADRAREHPAYELRQALANGSYSEEGWRIRKDGSRFWASVVLTTLRDESGRHVGFAKVTRDMTERRRAEEELREANEELERRVEKRTADLVDANKELATFSYSVSHDLRAPLRALDGFSRLLLDEAGAKLNAQEQDYLHRIRAASQRMAQLTDAMLMLARLTRAPVSPEPVDLGQITSGIVAELRQAEPGRSVEVRVQPDLGAIADHRLVRIVLENLLRNAWKFTRKSAAAIVEVGATDIAGEKVFFVRDNGVGFDPALSSKLFVPFQRLHRVRDYEGTGIGLATVHRIVQRHGGRIWAESVQGRGATFFFTLGGASAA